MFFVTHSRKFRFLFNFIPKTSSLIDSKWNIFEQRKSFWQCWASVQLENRSIEGYRWCLCFMHWTVCCFVLLLSARLTVSGNISTLRMRPPHQFRSTFILPSWLFKWRKFSLSSKRWRKSLKVVSKICIQFE